MAIYEAVLTLQATSGMPEDNCVNTLWFTSDENVAITSTAQIIGRLVHEAFEQPGDSLARFWSPEIGRTAPTAPFVLVYDRGQGSPKALVPFGATTAASAASGIPSEVAVCLSFRGDLTNVPEDGADDADPDALPERPASRRRGRIYFGPINADGIILVEAPTHPSAILTTALLRCADALRNLGPDYHNVDDGNAAIDRALRWIVFSRETNPPDGFGFPVRQAWVDDAFDTQRRRGRVATARTQHAYDDTFTGGV